MSAGLYAHVHTARDFVGRSIRVCILLPSWTHLAVKRQDPSSEFKMEVWSSQNFCYLEALYLGSSQVT